jgi:hypothetical protein
VAEKNAHYIRVVKDQPTLHTERKRLLWKQVPIADRQRDREERRTLKVLTVKADLLFPHALQATQIKRQTRASEKANGGPCPSTPTHQPAHMGGRPHRARDVDPRPLEHRETAPPRRDVAYGENSPKTAPATHPRNMAALRNLAGGALRLTGATNLTQKASDTSPETPPAP